MLCCCPLLRPLVHKQVELSWNLSGARSRQRPAVSFVCSSRPSSVLLCVPVREAVSAEAQSTVVPLPQSLCVLGFACKIQDPQQLVRAHLPMNLLSSLAEWIPLLDLCVEEPVLLCTCRHSPVGRHFSAGLAAQLFLHGARAITFLHVLPLRSVHCQAWILCVNRCAWMCCRVICTPPSQLQASCMLHLPASMVHGPHMDPTVEGPLSTSQEAGSAILAVACGAGLVHPGSKRPLAGMESCSASRHLQATATSI